MTRILAYLNIAVVAGILLAPSLLLPETCSIGIIGGAEMTYSSLLLLIVKISPKEILIAFLLILLIANTIVLFRTRSHRA